MRKKDLKSSCFLPAGTFSFILSPKKLRAPFFSLKEEGKVKEEDKFFNKIHFLR